MEVTITYENVRPLSMAAPQFMIPLEPGRFWSSLMLGQLANSSRGGLLLRDTIVFCCLLDPRLASSFDSLVSGASLTVSLGNFLRGPAFRVMPSVCFTVWSAASTVGFDLGDEFWALSCAQVWSR